jgi:hypothetical protein
VNRPTAEDESVSPDRAGEVIRENWLISEPFIGTYLPASKDRNLNLHVLLFV